MSSLEIADKLIRLSYAEMDKLGQELAGFIKAEGCGAIIPHDELCLALNAWAVDRLGRRQRDISSRIDKVFDEHGL